jgi:protein O-mannosyl-transferase
MNKKNKTIPKKELHRFDIGAIYPIFLIVIVLIVMFPALQNEFINWDDEVYITKNEVIKQVPFSNLAEIFTHKINNFSVPLTLLSFQIEYYFFGLNPFPYHFNNLLLHLANVILMYFFVKALVLSVRTQTTATKTETTAAFFVALLFGIHPMNVESVAWATERKDLLYTFFTLLALLQYLYTSQNEIITNINQLKTKHYWLSILFFVLSLLSKPQAIFFPVILLLIDYWKQADNQAIWRVLSPKKLIFKIPYFVISFLAGLYLLLNVGTRVSEKTLDYGFFDRFLFSCYQVCLYLVKFFFPFNLNNFYEYPIQTNGFYPFIFYTAPFALVGFLAFVSWKFRTNKLVVFGLLFYFANIFIFLQLFSVNTAIAYERFNYLAYNGLFLIGVVSLQKIKLSDYAKIGLVAYLVLFGILSFQRCKIWQNNIVFFADMAQKNPNDFIANSIALKNIGDALMEKQQLPEAIEKFTQSMGKDPTYDQAYLGRAYAYFISKRYKEAILDYNKFLALPSAPENKKQAIFNRGTCLMNLKIYTQAVSDFDLLIQADQAYISAYINRAFCLAKLGKVAQAAADYKRVLVLEPTNQIANEQLHLLQPTPK